MTNRTDQEAGHKINERIKRALDSALKRAESTFHRDTLSQYGLSERLKKALDELSDKSSKASSVFTNIVTCLAIKVALPRADIRYHQCQIQDKTDRPAGFNFRGVSETVVYPWLNGNFFEGAKSGWQTRTLERPKPYTMNYDENIADVKVPFLTVFDEVEVNKESASDGLAYLMLLQLKLREAKKIALAVPRTGEIRLILDIFSKHFFHRYDGSKGASRLPVLALYSIYMLMVEELERFEDMRLKPLESHSAADSQTGALGDIEVIDQKGRVFEALEIKHNIPLTNKLIESVKNKVMDKEVDRYYILTTHSTCEPDQGMTTQISNLNALYNCQVIANGVIPSMRYYLRLLSDPSKVFPKYRDLLQADPAITHEHRSVWNEIATEQG